MMTIFCNLYSGSSGNCLFIKYKETRIIIDAGLSGIAIERALKKIDEEASDIDAIVVTHDHSDHIFGVGVMSRRYDIPIYANSGTWSQMSASIGKIKEKNIKQFKVKNEFEIGSFGINSFSTPHDAQDPVAFCFMTGQKKITTATDIGHMNEDLLHNLEKSDLLLLESNYDVNMLNAGPYPYFLKKRILGSNGHLSNEIAAATVCELVKKGMTRFILGHFSKENNYPLLAYETTKEALCLKGIKVGVDVDLEIALRDKVGNIFEI